MRRAFTVIELLVAVLVLLAVIIATSKVFNSASKVASTGEAIANVLQQSSVLEEQMRRDLGRISRDGFLAIQCVEVPNDINVSSGGPLLNPQLPRTETIRCDQIVFFTSGTEVSARWAGPGDLVAQGGGQQAPATMVRYAHGVQVPRLTTEMVPPDGATNPPPPSLFPPVVVDVVAGPSGASQPLLPWTYLSAAGRALRYRYGTQAPMTQGPFAGSPPPIDPNQPESRQWVLARKSALLADDGGYPIFYPEPQPIDSNPVIRRLGPTAAPSVFGDRSNNANTPFPPGSEFRRWHWREARDRNFVQTSANLIPSPLLQSGWVDIAGSILDKVRRQISPTLRIQDPLDIGDLQGYVRTLSVPWSLGVPGQPGDVPLGWPTGTGAPPWPGDAQVVGIGNNQQPGTVADFSSQRDRIMRGCFGTPANGSPVPAGILGWPRAEKEVPNTDRRTEMVISPTLLTNCSSFRVDWTWEPGTGRQTDSAGAVIEARTGLGYVPVGGNLWTLRGYEPFAAGPWQEFDVNPPRFGAPQRWFGLPGPDNTPDPRTGVMLAYSGMPIVPHLGVPGEVANQHMRLVAQTIEGSPDLQANPPVTFPYGPRIRTYTAVFGFNQDDAYVVTPDGTVVLRDDFTPWPTQIRVTATIHDPRLVLDRGREVQFVLDVPKRRYD